jgi:membrane associated rhomboid family serine protease
MTITELSPETGDEFELAPVGNYPTLAQAHERALVVLAMNLECWILGTGVPEGYTLYAEPDRAPAINRELAEYEIEIRDGLNEQVPVELPKFSHGPWLAFLWAISLMACFLIQSADPRITPMFASNNRAIFEAGEWWRPVSALFLHGDAGHLLGNLAFGCALGLLASASIGKWLAWGGILLCGVAGNAMTAYGYLPDWHSAIGASTAVFGALGILGGFGLCVSVREPAHTPWASVIIPIGGAIALLGLYGNGGGQDNVDLLGHALGFAAGVAYGIAAGIFRLRDRNWTRQVRG